MSELKVTKAFDVKTLHFDLQKQRQQGDDVTLKGALQDLFGADYTPEQFYAQLEIDLSKMTVEKLITTSESTKWLFPEIFRDAIRKGLGYAPFHPALVTSEEQIDSTGITMPFFNPPVSDFREVNQGANIAEGVLTWGEKQVTIKKRAMGLKQTYESIMFTPIALAAIYFEDLGTQLGRGLDADFVEVLLNGDQADGSEAPITYGVDTINSLTYADIVYVWLRMTRDARRPTAMIANIDTALRLLLLEPFFNRQQPYPPVAQLNLQTPLPNEQDLYIHDDVPEDQIIFVDPTRAVVQLTAMNLLIESERIVSRQLVGDYASIITGFANVFGDARRILDLDVDRTP
jgi:hypothetical protein